MGERLSMRLVGRLSVLPDSKELETGTNLGRLAGSVRRPCDSSILRLCLSPRLRAEITKEIKK